MNKIRRVLLLLLVIPFIVGCTDGVAEKDGNEKFSVALLINGDLGDRSFFDSAADGVKRMEKELDVSINIVETGFDETKWQPALEDLSTGKHDIVIMGTWSMKEPLEEVAKKYPEQKYIFFDSEVDYEGLGIENVHSIQYKQNEGSFLAGALAALVSSSDMELTNGGTPYVGFLGAQDIPVINDFLVGYIEGAKYIDETSKIAISYIGDFENTAKGKEMAIAQYNQGVDIALNVAAQAGLGQIDAAKDLNKYSIGVNSDQHEIFKNSDMAKANAVVSSMLKRVDNSLFYAVERAMEGTLSYNEASYLGLEESAVGLAKNEYYNEIVPENIRLKLEEIEKDIISGKIKVSSAIGMSLEELDKIKDSAK